MKFKVKFSILFSVIIIATIASISIISVIHMESSIIDSEIFKMQSKTMDVAHDIEILHSRASEDLIFAVKNPRFVEYFELPDTQAGNVFDENNIMQFTTEQQEIKDELDRWIFDFQSKFSVDETCLIDAAGQEHTRLTFQEIAPNDDLSSEESAAPFFKPSFLLEKGQVHLQYPYVSPDSERWVFAYTTPIVTSDNSKPAFYHFEMPITIFQELVSVDVGRMYVIDPDGFIIADSDDASLANAKYNVNPQTITSFIPSEYFPSIQSVFASNTSIVIDEIKTNNMGDGTYILDGEKNYFVYEKLPIFDWILVYEKPSSFMISGDKTLDQLKLDISIISIIVILVGIQVAFIGSSRIIRPLIQLSTLTKSQNINDLKKFPDVKQEEVGDVTKSLNQMIDKINVNENKIREYNRNLEYNLDEVTQDLIKSEKLSAIGEMASRLSHDLKNPFFVLKNEFDILKSKKLLNEKQIGRIDRSMKKINDQLDDVLDFVRKSPLEYSEFNLYQTIKKYIELMDIPSKIKINIDDEGISMWADERKMEIVMNNLISNAIQAVEDGGNVDIIQSETDTEIIIIIKDSGSGITIDPIEKIFEPLITTKHEGTGLGLASVKHIIEQHDGHISAKNNPTTFTIKIPKKTV